jgi:predicted GTPase
VNYSDKESDIEELGEATWARGEAREGRENKLVSEIRTNLSDGRNLSDDERQLLEELRVVFQREKRRQFAFLLVGRVGVGKSSTVNTLLGEEVSKVSHFEPGTRKVRRHEGAIHGIRYSIVDTPGLADDEPEKGNDEAYLASIRRSVRRFDCFWFVTRLNDPRLGADEKRTVRLVTETLGEDIWERAIIVFTFSDMLTPAQFPVYLDRRTKLIREEIAKHTSQRIAKKVLAVAVANTDDPSKPKLLPNGEPWLGELYTEVFSKISDEGAVPFYLATMKRITPSSKTENSRSASGKTKNSRSKPENPITEYTSPSDQSSIPLNQKQERRIMERVEEHPVLAKAVQFLDKGSTFLKGAGLEGVSKSFKGMANFLRMFFT